MEDSARLHAPGPPLSGRVGTDLARVGRLFGLFWGATTLLLGGGGQRPAQSHPWDTTTHYATRVGERGLDRTMLLVLRISFRDKRQQKGFERTYSSISLYALRVGYWFKYETCTPQEKTNKHRLLFLSFFKIFFPPFGPNLKELWASAD